MSILYVNRKIRLFHLQKENRLMLGNLQYGVTAHKSVCKTFRFDGGKDGFSGFPGELTYSNKGK